MSKIEQKFHINIWRVGCRGDSRIARETSRKTNSNRVGRERGAIRGRFLDWKKSPIKFNLTLNYIYQKSILLSTINIFVQYNN